MRCFLFSSEVNLRPDRAVCLFRLLLWLVESSPVEHGNHVARLCAFRVDHSAGPFILCWLKAWQYRISEKPWVFVDILCQESRRCQVSEWSRKCAQSSLRTWAFQNDLGKFLLTVEQRIRKILEFLCSS